MSSTSLYGTTGNVTVSANNLTTLYNATPSTVVTANVPDRNFTTLYSTSSGQIMPTKAYGNSNVEAFLNQGTDGANTVQNIIMHGNLTVGGSTNLGNVGNVHITGGSSGYVLTTNGVGNLIWEEPQGGGGNTVPYVHFDVTSNGNNQSFTDANLGTYTNTDQMAVMKNGINIEPSLYDIAGDVLTINILLNSGDTIDVLPSGGGGGGGLPAGIPGAVQYNDGYHFAGSNQFLFDSGSNTLTVTHIVANGSQLTNITGANITGYVPNATHANTADSATHANVADVANLVVGSNVSGTVNSATYSTYVTNNAQANITSVGTMTGLTSVGTVDLTGSSNVSLGANTSVTGGSAHSLREPASVSGSSIAATQNIDVITSTLYYYTAQIAQDTLINIRGNSTTSLNSLMAVNDTITFTIVSTNNTSVGHLINLFEIDSTLVTPNYVGASPASSTSGLDIYVITVIKTASATFTLIVNRGSTV